MNNVLTGICAFIISLTLMSCILCFLLIGGVDEEKKKPTIQPKRSYVKKEIKQKVKREEEDFRDNFIKEDFVEVMKVSVIQPERINVPLLTIRDDIITPDRPPLRGTGIFIDKVENKIIINYCIPCFGGRCGR